MPQRWDMEHIGKTSRRAAIGSFMGFLLVVASLIYGYVNLNKLQASVTAEQSKLRTASSQLEDTKAKINRLQKKIDDLKITQGSLLDFLASATSQEQVKLIRLNPSVWQTTKAKLILLPAGQRKNAIFGSILLAWKDIPFTYSGNTLGAGLDSTTYMNFVLSNAGVNIPKKEHSLLSEDMMRVFQKVKKPKPGDLMFYKGGTGNFVVMYLAEGKPGSRGICIGTVGKQNPLQIFDSSDINEFAHPFLSYNAVSYAKVLE